MIPEAGLTSTPIVSGGVRKDDILADACRLSDAISFYDQRICWVCLVGASHHLVDHKYFARCRLGDLVEPCMKWYLVTLDPRTLEGVEMVSFQDSVRWLALST